MDEKDPKQMFIKTFDSVAEGYDNPAMRFFADSVPHLATHLNLGGDESILDVATGTGHTAIALARHVASGEVCGIDFSKGMLAKAEEKKKAAGMDNVKFMEMDMQSIQMEDGSFDRVVCSFGLFFVENLVGQLIHMAEKTKPGGRLATTCFGERLFLPQGELFLSRLERYGVEMPPRTFKRTDSESKCSALFKAAGLIDIQTYSINLGYYLDPPDLWWDVLWNAGYRGLISQLSENDLSQFKNEHLAEVATVAGSQGLWLDIPVIYTIGTKTK